MLLFTGIFMTFSTSNAKKSSGFTLIEILIVVAITAILAGISISQISKRIQAPDVAIDTSSLGLISTFSLARMYTFTGHLCCGQPSLPSGYGILIPLDTTTLNNVYYLYADFDGDLQYTTGGTDEILETRYLEEQVIFTDCSGASGSITPGVNNYCDIGFMIDPDTNGFRLHGAAGSLGAGWIDDYITVGTESSVDATFDDDITIYGNTFVVL